MSVIAPIHRPIVHPVLRSVFDVGVGGGGAAPAFDRVLRSAPEGFYLPARMESLFQDVAGTNPVTADGQTVRRISDLSGNGRHATNAAGWLLASDETGPYLVMDGASSFEAAMPLTAYPFTQMGVFQTTDAAGGAMSLWQANTIYKVTTKQATAREWRSINRGAAGTVNAVGAVPDSIGRQLVESVFRPSELSLAVNGWEVSSAANNNEFGVPTLFYIGRTRQLDGVMAGKFYGCACWGKELSDSERAAALELFRDSAGWAFSLAAVGDSHTNNSSLGLTVAQFHPHLTAVALGGVEINAGVSGATTGYAVSRARAAARGRPFDIGVIYLGTNDSTAVTAVQASPSPTATTFSVAAGIGARYGAGALISVGGTPAEVLSVAGDSVTLTAPLGAPPTAGAPVVLRMADNIAKIAGDLKSTHTLVCGQHYLNFASGAGDTVAVEQAASAQLRAAQRAAAEGIGAIYVDLHAYMRQLIMSGQYAQGDDTAWHTNIGDSHLNATGQQILSDAVVVAINANGLLA